MSDSVTTPSLFGEDAPDTAISKITLDDWKQLDPEAQARLLASRHPSKGHLNRQKNDSIEWAQHSWNPVTGCLHNCPYCYARDIAEELYEEKFAPTLHLARLDAPYRKPPAKAA